MPCELSDRTPGELAEILQPEAEAPASMRPAGTGAAAQQASELAGEVTVAAGEDLEPRIWTIRRARLTRAHREAEAPLAGNAARRRRIAVQGGARPSRVENTNSQPGPSSSTATSTQSRSRSSRSQMPSRATCSVRGGDARSAGPATALRGTANSRAWGDRGVKYDRARRGLAQRQEKGRQLLTGRLVTGREQQTRLLRVPGLVHREHQAPVRGRGIGDEDRGAAPETRAAPRRCVAPPLRRSPRDGRGRRSRRAKCNAGLDQGVGDSIGIQLGK